MLKITLLILGTIVAMVLLFVLYVFNYYRPNANKILKFIKKHPEKAAILWERNNIALGSKNASRLMPLASTVKIIIAIEYAIQSANGIIDPEETVELAALEKFHIPNTDGGAHTEWLQSIASDAENNTTNIRAIAKGMIQFSSNANTEWLLDKLGLENVNARLNNLGLKNHSLIFYDFASSLFIGKELYSELKEEELIKKLIELSHEDYIIASNLIHKKLDHDANYKNELGVFGKKYQQHLSQRMSSSTVEDYVNIMKKINSQQYFDTPTQEYLADVMEGLMNNPANQKWLQHAGTKGGSTMFVLTKALYATDKENNTTELAYFFNNLEEHEVLMLSKSLNAFELKLLTNPEFIAEVSKQLQ